jgi:riboflavin synthase
MGSQVVGNVHQFILSSGYADDIPPLGLWQRQPTLPIVFTGIISHIGRVAGVTPVPHGLRLQLHNPFQADPPKLGESIAVNGVCLTVAHLTPDLLSFDVIPQTLSLTNLGQLTPGGTVNLERSMRLGDRLDGHLVQGHADGTAELLWHRDDTTGPTGEWRTRLRVPPALAKYLIPKGSICLDGISLTLATVDGQDLEVALIPTTLRLTTLGQRPPGSRINVEADSMVKTVVSILERLPRQP